MSRIKKRREIERPSRVKLLLRRQRRNLRLLGFGAVAFGLVFASLAVSRSAQHGGIVAKLAESFGRATDLRVAKITFGPHPNTPEARLTQALGVAPGDPILGFSVDAARQRLETLPWIAHVSVERRLPGEIYVDLTEGRPFAIWQTQDKFLLIDRDGGTVANEDVTRFGELPLVVGPGAPAAASTMIDLLAKFPDLRPRVDAIVRIGQRRWNLQLKNHMTVMLPEGHEPEALQRLAELNASQALLDRPLDIVDLRLADKLTIRPRVAIGDAPAQDTKPASKSEPKTDVKPATARVPMNKPAVRAASGKPAVLRIKPAKTLLPDADDQSRRATLAARSAT